MNLKTYLHSRSQVELARQLGVTAGAISQWANGLSAVPAERCPLIEQATEGQVRCEDLRPDVAWSVLRNKPVATDSVADGVAGAHPLNHGPALAGGLAVCQSTARGL